MNATLTARAPALLAPAVILTAVAAGFLPVLWLGAAQGFSGFDPYLVRVLRFTLLQAGLSALLSILIGIPVARALARQSFPGRAIILRLLTLPMALPAIVVIIGVIEVYGTRGWLGGAFGLYGLQGILLAHVFFNFPLAARLSLSALERIPPESWKLAAQLDFGPRDIWRLIEWPQLRGSLPGIALLIFLLCASSFAIVLTLGGGPRATTLEVAIYQSLRADFDPPRAAALAVVQLLLCASLAIIAQRWGGLMTDGPTLRGIVIRYDGKTFTARLADAVVIGGGLLVLLPPLLALTVSGAGNIVVSTELLRAAATSLMLGLATAAVTLLLAWPLAAARSETWRKASGLIVLSGWIMPPAVLATGWFILLSGHADVSGLAPFLVIAMNGLMALPFAYQIAAPAVAQSAARHDWLCAGLGIEGFNRLRLIDLAVLRKPLALALVMGFVMSLGDLTAISLFGTQDLLTFPALIYRQMGTYRIDEAVGSALLLGIFVLALTTLAERWSSARD